MDVKTLGTISVEIIIFVVLAIWGFGLTTLLLTWENFKKNEEKEDGVIIDSQTGDCIIDLESGGWEHRPNIVKYPTLKDVEKADREQICRWWRFLPTPGIHTMVHYEFPKEYEEEVKIMDRICERYNELGGFTAEISKKVGWREE